MNFIKIRISKDSGETENDFIRSVDEMFRLFSPRFSPCERLWTPQMDIYDSPGEIVVLIDLAGVGRENIHVEIGNRTVKISGVRRKRPVTEHARYRRAEITYGYFERTFSVPSAVDVDSAAATYADGLLQISINKLPLDRGRKILIQSD
jgi:HSP20 family protein